MFSAEVGRAGSPEFADSEDAFVEKTYAQLAAKHGEAPTDSLASKYLFVYVSGLRTYV